MMMNPALRPVPFLFVSVFCLRLRDGTSEGHLVKSGKSQCFVMWGLRGNWHRMCVGFGRDLATVRGDF